MSDISVKPFSKIQVLNLDIAIYQDGSSVSPDGFVDWCIGKNPGGQLPVFSPTDPPVGVAGYIFLNGRSAIPMNSATGLPAVYHISGKLKIPPRFQLMQPADELFIAFRGLVGTGVTYSVNGTINYMFKV